MLATGKIDPSLALDPAKNDEAMNKMLEENEKAMKAMQQSYEEKLAESKNGQVFKINSCLTVID